MHEDDLILKSLRPGPDDVAQSRWAGRARMGALAVLLMAAGVLTLQHMTQGLQAQVAALPETSAPPRR